MRKRGVMPSSERLLSSARIWLPSALLAFEKSMLLLNLFCAPMSVALPPSGRDFDAMLLLRESPPISMVGFCGPMPTCEPPPRFSRSCMYV